MTADAEVAAPIAARDLPPILGLWRRFVAQRSAVIGFVIVLFVILVGSVGPAFTPHPFDETDLLNTWSPPSENNMLGTDRLGRDILSRLIVGARTSLVVAVTVLAITLLIGVAVGMAAGYLGGWIDGLLMRTVDVMLAFPAVIVAILVTSVLGSGETTVIISLSIVWWSGVARLTRSLTIVLRQELFIDAAIVSGTPLPLILWRHILPNIFAPILVRTSVGVGFIIMAEATLSFLGLGIQEPQASWGGMIRDGLPMLGADPYLALFGSLALGVTIIGFNLLGDGLRDMLDPRLQGR